MFVNILIAFGIALTVKRGFLLGRRIYTQNRSFFALRSLLDERQTFVFDNDLCLSFGSEIELEAGMNNIPEERDGRHYLMPKSIGQFLQGFRIGFTGKESLLKVNSNG